MVFVVETLREFGRWRKEAARQSENSNIGAAKSVNTCNACNSIAGNSVRGAENAGLSERRNVIGLP